MTRGSGSYGDGDEPIELSLEVIDLEPSERVPLGREPASHSGVRRPRGPVVVAVVVVLALVGFTIAGRSHHSSSAASSTTDARHTTINLDNGPGATGPLFPFRVGARLLVGGATGLQLVDTDTGRVTPARVRGLPPGQATIVAHSGGTVAVRFGSDLYWFTLADRIARPIVGDTAFPAARQGHLWIAGHGTAAEVPGAPHLTDTSGPAIGATRAGLLVATKTGVILQPTDAAGHTRLLLHAPATVIGVHPDRVAWLSNDCNVLRCPVHVTEVATGATSSWIQLVGHPSPLALAGSSAVFSPDGSRLAIVVANDSVTRAATIVVADLKTRASTAVGTGNALNEPARPGSNDATGMTVDWTLDSAYAVLAPGNTLSTGRFAVVDPGQTRIISSRATSGLGVTAAAIGTSTAGPLGRPSGSAGPIATGGLSAFAPAGLQLVGADQQQADVLDAATGRTTTWSVGGPVPNAAGPNSIARVTSGWLVVRNGAEHIVVDLLPAGGGPARPVADGFQVFSSDGGRHAWIVDPTSTAQTRVQAYDPATAGLAKPVTVAGDAAGAVDAGLIVDVRTGASSELDTVDPAGRVHGGPVLNSGSIHILAAAGTYIAFTDTDGLHVLDLTKKIVWIIASRVVSTAAFSPHGAVLAWIEQDDTDSHVLAIRIDDLIEGPPAVGASQQETLIGGPADRVLAADDGTVLFTNGSDVRVGRADLDGSKPVLGLAPDPDAELALG